MSRNAFVRGLLSVFTEHRREFAIYIGYLMVFGLLITTLAEPDSYNEALLAGLLYGSAIAGIVVRLVHKEGLL